MFPRQNQNQFRTANADVQIFYGAGVRSWTKPIGVSHVYMLLIGGGGNGNGATGGGSGAVTVWYGAAKNVPDNLILTVSSGATVNTVVNYRATNGLNALLTANAGSAGGGGAGGAMTANQFTASGFFQSIAGQTGNSSSVSASTTTFLGGGAFGAGGCTANYGYADNPAYLSTSGYFQLQPIIVGRGGSNPTDLCMTALGCGGGTDGTNVGLGGPGMVLIASW